MPSPKYLSSFVSQKKSSSYLIRVNLHTNFLFLSCKNVRFGILKLFNNLQVSSQHFQAYRAKHFWHVSATVFIAQQVHLLMFTMFSSSCIGFGKLENDLVFLPYIGSGRQVEDIRDELAA